MTYKVSEDERILAKFIRVWQGSKRLLRVLSGLIRLLRDFSASIPLLRLSCRSYSGLLIKFGKILKGITRFYKILFRFYKTLKGLTKGPHKILIMPNLVCNNKPNKGHPKHSKLKNNFGKLPVQECSTKLFVRNTPWQVTGSFTFQIHHFSVVVAPANSRPV